jgi:uncharacterized protein (DUF1778 family)
LIIDNTPHLKAIIKKGEKQMRKSPLTVAFVVTAEEKKLLKKRAWLEDKTLSQYLRDAAFEREVKVCEMLKQEKKRDLNEKVKK